MSYTAIASQTLASSASSVTFSSIPGDYRDLVLVAQYNGLAGANLNCRFNADTGFNYNSVYMYGFSGTTGSATNSSERLLLTIGSDGLSDLTLQIFDYAQTNKHKSTLSRSGSATTGSVEAFAGRWASTTAINSLQLYGGTFSIGSTFSLYGVSA